MLSRHIKRPPGRRRARRADPRARSGNVLGNIPDPHNMKPLVAGRLIGSVPECYEMFEQAKKVFLGRRPLASRFEAGPPGSPRTSG
jgi:hypothetical protein